MKGLYLLVFLFAITESVAQKEANVWITGNDFGIDFNHNRFRVFNREAYGPNLAAATSVSICNKETGDLLFYSDGNNVWDRNFRMMPNGRGLISGRLFGQHALIIPMPGTPDKYYLFTLKRLEEEDDGLYYTVIDMSLNGGLGDVVPETRNTMLLTNPLEVLTGTIHENGRDFWVLTHEDDTDRFVVFPITSQGVGQPILQAFGLSYDDYKYGGMAQFSPDRSMLAFNINISRNSIPSVNEYSPLELYDFNAETGDLSNRRVLGNSPNIQSILFSPDNSKLYMGSYNLEEPALYDLLWQYDLSANSLEDIIKSLDNITWGYKLNDSFSTPAPLPSFKMQLGPDGRLYNGAMPRNFTETRDLQRMIFYLDNPNDPLDRVITKSRYLDSSNNRNQPNSGVFEQSFPNFMQYHFNGLDPIDNSTTQEDCAEITLTIYPNPSEDFVSIKGSIANCLFPAYIKIYNASGQFLQEVEVFNEPFPQIDIRTYPTGVYFLNIETFNRIEVKKVIKK
ncbi:T9SS type A sorting domain-containing protein [Belliella marina]|uniref:T9SS type A sorting domain-containing protein n=1 Tax=Belliella marina TaxID=1644146 RepID=A0ABW4VGE2_9BACT